MNKTEWTIISILATLVLVVFVFLAVLVLGMLSAAPSSEDLVAEAVATATLEPPTPRIEKPTTPPTSPATRAPGSTETPRPSITSQPITPRPSPQASSAASGEGWEYKVSRTEKVKTLVWSEFGNSTEAKGNFLVVYLTLKNTGSKISGINPWDFELRDASGARYETSDAAGVYAFVEFSHLANIGDRYAGGTTLNTALIFDVDPNASGYTLYLKQSLAGIDLKP